MKTAHLLGAVAAGLMLSASAHAALVPVSPLGGRFYPGQTSGYIDAVFPPDTTGVSGTIASPGQTVEFNRSINSPGPISLVFDSPIYGDISLAFSVLASFAITPAGEFFTELGSGGFISVNLVNPGYGISSFGFTGEGSYTPAPPPIADPPPCVTNCGGGGVTPPPVVVGTPEPSTWALLLIGFAGLGFAAKRRTHRARLASI